MKRGNKKMEAKEFMRKLRKECVKHERCAECPFVELCRTNYVEYDTDSALDEFVEFVEQYEDEVILYFSPTSIVQTMLVLRHIIKQIKAEKTASILYRPQDSFSYSLNNEYGIKITLSYAQYSRLKECLENGTGVTLQCAIKALVDFELSVSRTLNDLA